MAAKEAALNRKVNLQVARLDNEWRGMRIDLRLSNRRLRVDEPTSVGMLRSSKDFFSGSRLDDYPVLHDKDTLGQQSHDGEVVGDEEDGHTQLPLQRTEKLEDLRLNGHIEGGRGLVGDEKIGLVGQGHGDHHALALASR